MTWRKLILCEKFYQRTLANLRKVRKNKFTKQKWQGETRY